MWIVSVPCGDGSVTIGDIFSDDLGDYDGSGGADNWIMYEQNGTDWSGEFTSMRKMELTDSMELGKGYWIITDGLFGITWKVDAAAVTTRTPLRITNEVKFAGRYDFTLPVITTTDDPKKVMVGNPFPRKTYWDSAELLIDGTAQPLNFNGIINTTAYAYDISSGTGQPYRAMTYNTPGLTEPLEPYQGFWIRVEPAVDLAAGSLKLTLPFEK
jgi:hypothetical protein